MRNLVQPRPTSSTVRAGRGNARVRNYLVPKGPYGTHGTRFPEPRPRCRPKKKKRAPIGTRFAAANVGAAGRPQPQGMGGIQFLGSAPALSHLAKAAEGFATEVRYAASR